MIEEKLGEGGMGCVYRARHTVLDRAYAIKVLFADFASDPRFLTRFRREAQSMSRVRHENIVSVEDFGTSPEGQTFLAMELVSGRTLEQVIRSEAPIPPPRAAKLVRQMAAGLGAAHAGGFVHRDVKPSNVMVTLEGTKERVKILDFGAVNLSSASTNERLTHVGHIIGTPTYMAPEQSQDPNVGPTADLYALGVVLYEMLDGRPPFDGPGRAEILVKHISLPAPELPPHAGLERIVAQLLRKLPSERPQSTDALIQLLDALELEGPEEEATAVTPLELDRMAPSSAPTPPTRTDPGAPAEDLRALYQQLRARPASTAGDDVLAQDTFRPLESGLDFAPQWSHAGQEYHHAIDEETDDAAREPPLIAEDLVLETPSVIPSDRATRPAAVATQVVRERLSQSPHGSLAEVTDPVDMYRSTPTPLAPTHESDDGGPTQVDFEIGGFEDMPAPLPLDITPADPPERPLIQEEVSDLAPDGSETLLDGDEPEDLPATVALIARASLNPAPDSESVTPEAAPVFEADTLNPPGADPDELPTSESPPPVLAPPMTPAQAAPAPSKGPPLLYYVAIAGLSVLILVLGWILLSGRRPIDLGAQAQPARATPSAPVEHDQM